MQQQRSRKITAVIPLFNKERYISGALRSVYSQKMLPSETIIVNDASTDDSLRNAQNFPNHTCLRIVQRSNPGPGGYAARNFGAGLAKTEWLAFLDADDLWTNEHIFLADSILERHKKNDLLFMSFFKDKVDGTRSTRRLPVDGFIALPKALELFARVDAFHTNAVIVSKKLFDRAGRFPEEKGYRRGGDSELWLRLLWENGGTLSCTTATSIHRAPYSQIVNSSKNVSGRHPVRHASEVFLGATCDRDLRNQLKRLSNRKTLEWLSMQQSLLVRLRVLSNDIYYSKLHARDLKKIFKSIV